MSDCFKTKIGVIVKISPEKYHSSTRLALAARYEIVNMVSAAQAPHIASALSVVDILSVLYTGAANINPENLEKNNRDVVILSKGHAASALYAILSLQNFYPTEILKSFCQNDAPLGGHVTFGGVPGVEFSTGSLGHGLPYGLGIALSRKRGGIGGRVFVVVSDGECDEGTTWESAMIANHHELDNLVVIIDRNKIQSLTFTEETLKLEPLLDKWNAFGWETKNIDGHNHDDLIESFKLTNRPKCIVANTVKGKGINFMENSVLWHYKSPNKSDVVNAIVQLEENY